MDILFALDAILMARDVTTCSIVYFLMYGVWPSLGIIQCTYTSSTTFTDYGVRLSVEFGFCRSIEFNTQHNQSVLVMVKHFSKWLELALLPNYSSGGTIYAFLDRMFNQFGIPTK